MKEFNSYTPDIIDPDADNPYGTFVDEGGGEAGSPVLADFMNTVKALFEKVMSEAGITYDDAVDTVTSCQSWDAFKSLFVDLVAAQTIAGIKTFSSIPVLPSSNPTNDNHAARKAYVDGLTDALQLLVDALDSRTTENKNYALGIPTTLTAKGSALSISSTGSYPRITALSSKRIAYFDVSNSELRTYEFQISKWVQIGNSLSLSITSGASDITALSSSRIALADATNDELKAYDFDGTNWSQVGNAFSITSLASSAISALSSTRIAYFDIGNNSLRIYDFDGIDWSQFGIGTTVTAASTPYMCTLAENRIAMRAETADRVNMFTVNDLGNWSEVGTPTQFIENIYGVTALSPTRIVAGQSTGSLQIHEIIGESFAATDAKLTLSGGTSFDVEALSPTEIVLVADNSIQLYEIGFTVKPPSPVFN